MYIDQAPPPPNPVREAEPTQEVDPEANLPSALRTIAVVGFGIAAFGSLLTWQTAHVELPVGLGLDTNFSRSGTDTDGGTLFLLASVAGIMLLQFGRAASTNYVTAAVAAVVMLVPLNVLQDTRGPTMSVGAGLVLSLAGIIAAFVCSGLRAILASRRGTARRLQQASQ
ncbi:MAG TPA: hypothetical protein VI759_01415 [Dehalococcoidia bacterium]|nr:hypothetical protein [Dehalococcoidia bacterium]